MGRKKDRPPRQAPPKPPSASKDGGHTGGGTYGHASGGGFASFLKQFLLAFVFVLMGLMIMVVWFFYRPRLETLVLAVVLLAVVLGSLLLLLSLMRKRSGKLEDDQPINETHDRRDYPREQQEEFGSSLITQNPFSQTSESNEKEPPPQDLGNVKDAFKALVKRVNEIETLARGIDARLAELEQQLYYSRNPKPMEERRPAAAAPASPPPRRSASDYNTTYRESQSRPSSIDLSSLSQAVCRFLADQTGSWEVERLVQSVQRSMDGNASIDVEHLVPYSSGEWRLVALWPQRSQEGLVLVSSGELVDDDIARYFDVSYGRRVIACKQPARVARSGAEVTVLQKGKVESS